MNQNASIEMVEGKLTELKSDLLIVPISELKDLKSEDLKGLKKAVPIKEIALEEGFKAKQGQLLMFRGVDGVKSPRILFVGLGEKEEEVRASLVKAVRKARAVCAKKIAVFVPKDSLTREVLEGVLLGSYVYDRFKTVDESEENPYKGVEKVTLTGHVKKGAVDLAKAYSKGICKARDLGNGPPNYLYPQTLAEEAVKIAKEYGLKHTVFDEKYLQENGFNLLMAVGRGSVHQPRLIHLEYRPEGEVKKTIALVGKGITFDTGGYNVKTGGHMLNMHLDMGGAAAVFGAAEIIGQLKPKGVAIHFIVPSAHNSISSDAYLPNDIIKGLGGKTVEIQNTDAEGRLVLADGLAYALQQSPDEIIDLATLTGACVVALGESTAALYSTDDDMVEGLLKAAKANDEDLWHMPLTKKLDSELDSKFADMRNIGNRYGGSITAALFLKRWVDSKPWAHIDLAGPAMASSDTDLSTAGGTGYGAALLSSYIMKNTDASVK